LDERRGSLNKGKEEAPKQDRKMGPGDDIRRKGGLGVKVEVVGTELVVDGLVGVART